MTPDAIWYDQAPGARALSALLAPLGWLYCGIAAVRAGADRVGLLGSGAVSVPVIVVGNLSVGGTGKTPLVLWLAAHLQARGLRPGVATRGYRGRQSAPALIPADADATAVGDESALLARRAGCPVAVGRDRLAAARLLVDAGCDPVITDDGLQHYRLRRDCEILVIDGDRLHGNGRCLPAGPLREPRGRAARADLILYNGGAGGGFRMTLVPADAVNLYDSKRRRPLSEFAGRRVTAVAGIGNPGRFFAMLRALGVDVVEHPYPDHHAFSEADWSSWREPVVMTEKDAVKCACAGLRDAWIVPVDAVPDAAFVAALDEILDRLPAGGRGGC